MQTIHETILDSSSIQHAISLPHFTPSTIYPFPQPRLPQLVGTSVEIKVVGNIVVAGGSDLRVFEVREEPAFLHARAPKDDHDDEIERVPNGKHLADAEAETLNEMEDGDGFKTMGSVITPAQNTVPTVLKLHLLCHHTIHGTITGLAPIRTMASVEDGLDRLLVSLKDAKVAMLEWSRGELATVSLHTYERCPQVMLGDLHGFSSILRSDPLSRLAALLLPSDALAMLPIVQDLTETEMLEAGYARDVPYTPSFVLPLSDLSDNIKNVKDFTFLAGFNNPTICLLFCPTPTFVGRYSSVRDTFQLEIRTLDLNGKTYASLTTVRDLPSDCQYIIPCPSRFGGVLVVAETSIIHIDQSGNTVCAAVNGWFSSISGRTAVDRDHMNLELELDDSRLTWLGNDAEADQALLILKDGTVHQLGLKLEGRAVSKIEISAPISQRLVIPSAAADVAGKGVFVACAVGDSVLARVEMHELKLENGHVEEERTQALSAQKDAMDEDLEDLYGDSLAEATDAKDDRAKRNVSLQAVLCVDDALVAVGAISDMTLGLDAESGQPELVVIGGGAGPSVLNRLVPGVPARQVRRFRELEGSQGVWSLAVHKEHERVREMDSVLIYAIADDGTIEELQRIDVETVEACQFLSNYCFAHVTPHKVSLRQADGSSMFDIEDKDGDSPIVAASISDPFIAIRRGNGLVTLLRGDIEARSLVEVPMPSSSDPAAGVFASCCIFSDRSGVFRTFEVNDNAESGEAMPSNPRQRGRVQMQFTDEQLQRLQAQKPAITEAVMDGVEFAVDQGRGLQWLCLLGASGRLEIRSLPALDVVFRAVGLTDSVPSLVDQGDDIDEDMNKVEDSGKEDDEIDGMALAAIGSKSPRPHLITTHASGRLTVYEAQPRYTLDTADVAARRTLAVRFSKVVTHLLPRPKLARRIIPFEDIAGQSGAALTGFSALWISGRDAKPVEVVPDSSPAYAFSPYRAEDGSSNFVTSTPEGTAAYSLSSSRSLGISKVSRRVPLERTYTNIIFDTPSKMYLMASVMSVPFQVYSDECEVIPSPQVDNATPPQTERSALELWDPATWQCVDGYDFDENEVLLCLQSMDLEATSDPTGRKPFIVVGTTVNRGEDMSTKGNIYVFEVVDVVEVVDAGSRYRRQLRLVVKEEGTAPVTAINSLSGYLIHAMGQKVFVKALDLEERLVAVAFLDVAVYVTSIGVLKNLILIGDQVKSVWFAAFQESPFKLELLGRDFQDASLTSAEFLAADGKVSFVVHDVEGVLRMLEYDPDHVASKDGERLLRRVEFNAAADLSKCLRVARRRTADPKAPPQIQLIYATGDGAIRTLVPSKPARFKRLQLLQGQLNRSIQHVAGANPRAFRTVPNDLYSRPLSKGILDGQLLSNFVDLSVSRQRELLEPIGTDRETVLNDISELSGMW